MADHEVAFLVLPAQHVLAVADGGLLQVQGVQVHDAVHALDAGHAGHVLGLVHVRGIDDHGPGAIAGGELVGQLGAQRRRMDDAVGAGAGVLQEQIGHLIGTALHGQQAAAPAHEHIHVLQGDPRLAQQSQYGVPAIGQLIGDGPELRQLRRIVGDVFGKQALFTLEQGDLGGGGAGIDRQNFVFAHGGTSFFYSSKASPRRSDGGTPGCH